MRLLTIACGLTAVNCLCDEADRRLASRHISYLAAAAVIGVSSPMASAIEEPKYTVERRYDGFEVREYAPYLVAEVAVAEAPKTEPTDALKDVESTAKALDDVLSNKEVKVDKAKLKKVNNEISKLIDIDNKEPKLKKIKEQGGKF